MVSQPWESDSFECCCWRILEFHTTGLLWHQRFNPFNKLKKNEERMREVERSMLTPLVFSCTRDLGPAASTFYKWLAAKLSDKRIRPLLAEVDLAVSEASLWNEIFTHISCLIIYSNFEQFLKLSHTTSECITCQTRIPQNTYPVCTEPSQSTELN